MTDGELAVIGLGSAGSMALWQAAKLSGGGGVVGFEAWTPAHGRSAVGGDSRLFRMTFREQHDLSPLLASSLGLWRELESDSGQEILTRCGGLSIGDRRGYVEAILRNVRETGAPHTVLDAAALRARYPQHRVSDDDAAVLDPRAGFLRTDRAVLSAVAAAEKIRPSRHRSGRVRGRRGGGGRPWLSASALGVGQAGEPARRAGTGCDTTRRGGSLRLPSPPTASGRFSTP